jgi:hypothetical protein
MNSENNSTALTAAELAQPTPPLETLTYSVTETARVLGVSFVLADGLPPDRATAAPAFAGSAAQAAPETASPRLHQQRATAVGVSGRDGATPGREPEHSCQVAESAGRRRAERRSAPESPRPCRILPPLHEAAPIQRSAAQIRVGRQFPSGGCPVGSGQRVLRGECHSPVSNSGVTYARPALPFWGKESSVPLKENETTFS